MNKTNKNKKDTSFPKNNQVNVFNSFEQPNSTKRYQTKMLLASLIEHFCRTYGDTPDANRKVFFLICQTLRSLGIIDAEFMDEMATVRSAFQNAFHKLFYTAVQTVRNQDLVRFDDNLSVMLIKSTPEDTVSSVVKHNMADENPESSNSSSSSSSSSSSDFLSIKQQKAIDYFNSCYTTTQHPNVVMTPSSSFNNNNNNNNISKLSSSSNTNNSSSFHSFVTGDDFFHNLNVQNSRYNNDFIELGLLGKGGFASAFRARNRLDGIDYAIKKIRLGNDIEETKNNDENPYEKIFREIKNLARLEHHNVIRYYSSWLEYDEYRAEDALTSDWEEESRSSSSYNKDRPTTMNEEDSNSVFGGRDPTFFSEYSLSSLGYGGGGGGSVSGMSHIQFGESTTNSYDSNHAAITTTTSTSTTMSESWPTSNQQCKSISSSSNQHNMGTTNQVKSGWTLFIQMQLCPTTLHDYIRFRNKRYSEEGSFSVIDTRRNIEIFAQILEGTAYIHDQGLIHRDLKPSNIFLSMPNGSTYVNDIDGKRRRRRSSNTNHLLTDSISSSMDNSLNSYDSNHLWDEAWVPKIGDFGLAAEVMDDEKTGSTVLIPTPISSTPPSPKLGPQTHSQSNSVRRYRDRPHRPRPRRTRTIGVGTRTYASPEQLAVPAQAYDEKVDIYSLGIILFELFQPFSTGMERADSIEKLKQGIFPDGFLKMYPKVTALIIWMMDHKPDHRPSAHQLLGFELFSHPSVQDEGDLCLTLQTQLQSKVNQLERKNKEIEELKEKLEKMENEKRRALVEMQQRLDEMQQRLDSLLCKEEEKTKRASGLHSSASFLKKKKEVTWSSLDSIAKE
ncbi:kinase-like domain-containing protein [Cokeromyces recurvatus]|uniref:kinase-like domain-containing protein n=1 Tax=Cokeromyces recurvatus TaxID=90255 RepID=UPI00221EB1D1|nr:kinase-like domain-containing protein [Cokeromyces recurvatus]KAI7903146.1 kinase-like domain-containing protein [Cokeromyces recurvatus]